LKQVYTKVIVALEAESSALLGFEQVIWNVMSCPTSNLDATLRTCATPALVTEGGVKVTVPATPVTIVGVHE